jgi:pSer/pThr/pTyr-binding forkhead associated (FHA) protein
MPPLSAPPGSFAPESAHGPDATQILASPVGEKSVVAWVVVASGSLRGRDFRLPGGTARLGSAADCEVRIADDPYISSHHAELVFGGGQYVLRDLQSTNGSFVNDSRVAEQQLRDGDRVRLGQTKLVFKSFNL